MKTLAFIFARGGSKGVPGKNIKPLNGKPLIAYSIEVALACTDIETVIVSTDDDEIAEVSKAYGAEVPFMRPAELATDNSSEWLAWQHAINWVEQHWGVFDIFISLPATAPFRSVVDINNCISAIKNNPQADMVISVKEASRSPFFNMVRLNDAGFAQLACSSTDKITRRQDAPVLYDMTTVAYAARPQFIVQSNSIFDGRVKTVVIPVERSLDIDTPYDFALAEIIMQSGLHKIEYS